MPSEPRKRSADSEDSVSSFKRVKDVETLGEVPAKKISFGLSQQTGSKIKSNSLKIGFSKSLSGAASPANNSSSNLTRSKVAAAFEDDAEDEEEEMPPEAKMRMKNIGRDTPTSAGPNSFGKSRIGFCDSKKVYEKKMKETEKQLLAKEEGTVPKNKSS
ncbi:PEST proteolytic signal-containing nuclear protein [Trinorchestia longiramus]|nr:PEST proteolytic signal-containing nuclear protein [Trinorchestia longiramus]